MGSRVARLEHSRMEGLRNAETLSDQRFLLIDRTSLAMMEHLQVSKAISFDDDCIVRRLGPDRRGVFEVSR